MATATGLISATRCTLAKLIEKPLEKAGRLFVTSKEVVEADQRLYVELNEKRKAVAWADEVVLVHTINTDMDINAAHGNVIFLHSGRTVTLPANPVKGARVEIIPAWDVKDLTVAKGRFSTNGAKIKTESAGVYDLDTTSGAIFVYSGIENYGWGIL